MRVLPYLFMSSHFDLRKPCCNYFQYPPYVFPPKSQSSMVSSNVIVLRMSRKKFLSLATLHSQIRPWLILELWKALQSAVCARLWSREKNISNFDHFKNFNVIITPSIRYFLFDQFTVLQRKTCCSICILNVTSQFIWLKIKVWLRSKMWLCAVFFSLKVHFHTTTLPVRPFYFSP